MKIKLSYDTNELMTALVQANPVMWRKLSTDGKKKVYAKTEIMMKQAIGMRRLSESEEYKEVQSFKGSKAYDEYMTGMSCSIDATEIWVSSWQ